MQPRYGDLALLACCFVSGLLDAAAFDNYSVFIGMQTGNTVLLGLSTASLPVNTPLTWAKTLVAIASFLCGAFGTFTFHRVTARGVKLRRVHVVASFGAQTLLLILAAALCSTSLVPTDPLGKSYILNDPRTLTALPLLAFQSGMQIATGRLLGFGEVPTVVLTSVYADLMGDVVGLKAKNDKRDRRIGAVVLLLGGAICSGWLLRAGIDLYGVIWITVGIKTIVTVSMWLGLQPVRKSSEKTEPS